MSAQVKKAGKIGTKIVAVFLFLFLILFNVQVGLYDGESSERSILGLTMSVFVPGALGGSDISVCLPTSCEMHTHEVAHCYYECSDGATGECIIFENGPILCGWY